MTNADRLGELIELIRLFLDEKVTAGEFERSYLDLFKSIPQLPSEEHYLILNELFGDVDAFCNIPEIFDPQQDIDEQELRQRCRETLDQIDGYPQNSRLVACYYTGIRVSE